MTSPRPEAPVPVSGRQVELVAGDLRATVVEVGGGVRSFTRAAFPVLDGYEFDEMATVAQGQALMPWPNRLADGQYEFAGRSHQLPLTERPEPSPGIVSRPCRRGRRSDRRGGHVRDLLVLALLVPGQGGRGRAREPRNAFSRSVTERA